MFANPNHQWTVEEYLAFERASEVKHEFLDGEIFEMAGASANHSRIIINTTRFLANQLDETPCQVFDSNLRVKVSPARYTYPDLSIVCGKVELEDAELDTLLNPTVIVEVLSPSTENYDRGKKFEAYRALESLQEYVLIAQDRPYIERYVRQSDGWLLADASGLEGEVALAAAPATLRLAEVYRRVEFEIPDASGDL